MDSMTLLEKKIKTLSLDDFEIYLIESRGFLAQSNEGKVEFTEESTELGTAIRLFKGGKIGLGCSSDWSAPFLERMVDQAYSGLLIGDQKQPFDLPGPFKNGIESRVQKDPTKKEQLEIALVLEREARGYDPRVRRVRDARYSGGHTRVILKNSRGLEAEYTKSTHEVSLMVMAEEKEEREMAWDSDFSSVFSGIDPVKIGRRVAEKAVSQLGARPIQTQKAAAILDQTVAASFLGVLSSSFLADQVQKQRSSLRGRLGQTIYSDQVTLLDDGQLENGCLTAPFDGEGTLTRRNELVSHGVLQSFLYDALSAGRDNVKSTGNAVRPHYKEAPRVGVTNFFLVPGCGSLESLFQSMGTGFWIRDVIGIHTADAVTGDFSVGASGIWIENGQRKNPVRGVTISGNLHDLLKNVVKVGEDIRFYHSYGAPSVWIRSIDIGGL